MVISHTGLDIVKKQAYNKNGVNSMTRDASVR